MNHHIWLSATIPDASGVVTANGDRAMGTCVSSVPGQIAVWRGCALIGHSIRDAVGLTFYVGVMFQIPIVFLELCHLSETNAHITQMYLSMSTVDS